VINNMGKIDRIIRVIVAVVIAVLWYYKQMTGLAAMILGLIAVLFIVTGAMGYCPIYHLLGLSTKEKK